VDDGERDREHACQGLRQQRLAGPCRADEQDVGLLQFDVLPRVALMVVDALVVVVDSDRELLLRPLLSDHVEIEEFLDLFRLRKRAGAFQRSRLVLAVLGDDVEADVDAFVTDVDRRSGDQLLDVALRLVAEATTQYVAAIALLRHSSPSPLFFAVFRFFYALPTLSRSRAFVNLCRSILIPRLRAWQTPDRPVRTASPHAPAGCSRDRCPCRSFRSAGRCAWTEFRSSAGACA